MIERICTVLQTERHLGEIAMLIVEQNVAFALKTADRYAVLERGELVEQGRCDAPDAAQTHPARSSACEKTTMLQLNTFSIVARCERTGELGVAVATAVPAVGSMCPHLVPGVGAASTQSWVNPYLAIRRVARPWPAGPAGAPTRWHQVLAA